MIKKLITVFVLLGAAIYITAKNLPDSFETARPEPMSGETRQAVLDCTIQLMAQANKSQSREFGQRSLCAGKNRIKQYRTAYNTIKTMRLNSDNIDNVFTINGSIYYVTMTDHLKNSYELQLTYCSKDSCYKVYGFEEI